MKLYKQLQLEGDQRAVMAERWRSWCRRRRRLDLQLASALRELEVRPPRSPIMRRMHIERA